MNFYEKVYSVVRLIPKGRVASYGDIAKAVGNVKMARFVGFALHVNPDPQNIPCYRVVFKDGRLSSAFRFGGIDVQKELLKKDGIKFDKKGRVKPCFFVEKII